jgi:hypothetical protein
MKLNELLNDQETNVEAIVAKLKSNCSDFIAAYHSSGKALLRGINKAVGSKNPIITGTVRADRRPSATPQKHFDLMNQALEELNLPTRANTIACSTNKTDAGAWGPVHVLFMKDGFNGLTMQHGDFDDMFVRADKVLHSGGDASELAEIINKMRPILVSSSTTLSKVLSGNYNEIIMQGTQYYALRVGAPLTNEVLKALNLKLSNL